MSIEKGKQDYYDGFEGLEKEMAKSKVELSQCVGCENNVGFDTCKYFKNKPYEYASALAKVRCPERKVK